ncbi:MAG TPA: XkdX family protein [Bacillus bacterium]|nr:XkdX family protein [Bacillus sp. (in: firmicutes)]
MLTFEKIKGYYEGGYWTKEQVETAVKYKKITTEQYETITGEAYTE